MIRELLDWGIRLTYIWVLRVISVEKAEAEIRKWNGEIERKMWGPQTRKKLRSTGFVPDDGFSLAKKVQQQTIEWDTAAYETDPVSGQSQLHDAPPSPQFKNTK